MADNPYRNQPQKAFWRQAIAECHVADMADLWEPIPLTPDSRVATAGSCFSQHIGHNLKKRGIAFMDMEPAPPVFASESDARRFGYGVFSCRYGNVYTSRQLLQLLQEAFGERSPQDFVWEKRGRFFDALRPGITPVGEADPGAVIAGRAAHLAAVRRMFETLDVFVFTMGLTEGWEDQADGTILPGAPGTIAGTWNPDRYVFRNMRYPEVMADMQEFWRRLRAINPTVKMLVTVSPVPLIATATDQHVLPATVWSKSVLRAVAGDLATDHPDIYYFPSYEIINAPGAHGVFFEPDLRNVNEMGVNLVMQKFFTGPLAAEFGKVPAANPAAAGTAIDLVCDESRIVETLD